MTSDTVSAARAVSTYFDELTQVDCELHVVNLILEYGIGMMENWSTDRSTGKREIVTPREALVERKENHRATM